MCNSVGYIEFKELETVQKALNLSGTRLLGLPIMVQYTEAERNRQASSSTPATLDTNITMSALLFQWLNLMADKALSALLAPTQVLMHPFPTIDSM